MCLPGMAQGGGDANASTGVPPIVPLADAKEQEKLQGGALPSEKRRERLHKEYADMVRREAEERSK